MQQKVRNEAQKMLVTAIADRNKEALTAGVALATQLRLRSPQVQEAKLLIAELNKEEALGRVRVAMEDEDFDALLKSAQVRRENMAFRCCVAVAPVPMSSGALS